MNLTKNEKFANSKLHEKSQNLKFAKIFTHENFQIYSIRKRLGPKIQENRKKQRNIVDTNHQTSLLRTCYPSYSVKQTYINILIYTIIVRQTSHCVSVICYTVLKMMFKQLVFLVTIQTFLSSLLGRKD